MANRYELVINSGETQERIAICNSRTIAMNCFETACRKEGVISVKLIDLRTGEEVSFYDEMAAKQTYIGRVFLGTD